MVIREVRRFVKSSPTLSIAGLLVMVLGLSVSASSLVLLAAFSTPRTPGVRTHSFATMAVPADGGSFAPISWNRYTKVQNASPLDVTIAAYSQTFGVDLQGAGESQQVQLAAASSSVFPLLEHPLIGRSFTAEEEQSTAQHAVILSDHMARSLFGFDSSALSRVIKLGGVPYTVIGVAPADFTGLLGGKVDAWVGPGSAVSLIIHLPSVSKVNPEVWRSVPIFDIAVASTELSPKALVDSLQIPRLIKVSGEDNLAVARGLTLDPKRDENIRRWCRMGLLLSTIFTLVSCLDVCLLLMARSPIMVQESALKNALGAGPVRLLVEMMTGPCVLLGTGIILSALLTLLMLRGFEKQFDFSQSVLLASPHLLIVTVSLQGIAAVLLVLTVTLPPAFFVFRCAGAPRSGYSTTSGRGADRSIVISVILQIACCTMTCILATMIVSALLNTLHQTLGYEPSGLQVVTVAPAYGTMQFSTGNGGLSPEAVTLRQVMESVRHIPGVEGVGYISSAPFNPGIGNWEQMQQDSGSTALPHPVDHITVSPSYFDTARMHLMAGQGFRPQGGAGPGQIILSRLLSGQLFPGGSPIGRTVQILIPAWSGIPASQESATVVGVVDNVRQTGFTSSPEPAYYTSNMDGPFMDVRPQLVIRGNVTSSTLKTVINQSISALMPGMAVADSYSIPQVVAETLAPEKRRMEMAVAGSLVMSAMAYIGLYASLAYYVRSKRRDLAIRLCLGASTSEMRTLVMRRALRCASWGVAMSAPLVFAVYKLTAVNLLGAVAWSTPRALLVIALCFAASLGVSLPSGREASRIVPAEVLRG